LALSAKRWAGLTHRTDLYARRVCGDRTAGPVIVAGPLVRLACERHLRDRVDPRGMRFDAARAQRIIDFFEHVLRLPDMLDDNGQPLPFLLQPFQDFILGSLFGWLRADGSRRFREAYIEMGKGNGKTPLCAGVGLYGLFLDGERAAEVYAAASDQAQAQTLFRYAVNMAQHSPLLAEEFTYSGASEVWKISHPPSLSFFRTFSRESGAKSGPIPHMGLLDELHEHPTPQISIKIRAGAKRRQNALFLEITNSGFDRTSICWAHHEHSRRVLEGLVEDDQWFAFVCALDEDDDPLKDEGCWIKANPNLGVSIQVDYLRRQVNNARHIPAEENTVRRLNFCQWTQSHARYFDAAKWRACGALTWTPEDLATASLVVGAFDLGQTDDFSAWVRLWMLADGRVVVIPRFWLPQSALDAHPHRPYAQWQRAGVLEVTEGDTTDYGVVEAAIAADAIAAGVVRVGFDKRFAAQMAQNLQGRGIDVVDVPQGFFLTEAIRLMGAWVSDKRLAHGSHPVLSWMADNAVVKHGPDKRLRLDKEAAADKIDGIVALAMAAQMVISQPERAVEVEAWVI
jgi:phage terminase large subunit-like protein